MCVSFNHRGGDKKGREKKARENQRDQKIVAKGTGVREFVMTRRQSRPRGGAEEG